MSLKLAIPLGVMVLLLALLLMYNLLNFTNKEKPMELGVTFSQYQAEYLGLDWRATYTDILDNLKVKNLRLLAYWNQIEKKDGSFDFSDLDWQVAEAEKRGAKIILAVGRRVPHWPECHVPAWAKTFPEKEAQNRVLDFVSRTIKHYQKNPAVVMWQIENEPLVDWFGNCPAPDKDFLKREIALARGLDTRPIMITDSGELSTWRQTAKLGDFFGTTLYRTVWHQWIGYWSYDLFLPASFYRFKAWLNGIAPEKAIVAELQAEAWLREDISKVPVAEQYRSMNFKRLKKNVEIARAIGFSQAYLWGAEYWYWLKEKQGDSGLYEAAKAIFNQP